MVSPTITAIIFDLGGVLIDWNPRHLYRKLITDEQEMTTFLDTITTPDWNEEQDAGRSLADGTAALVARHPQHRELIEHFYGRWSEMLGGAIQGTVDILTELRASQRYHLYALTNWSAETFPVAQAQFEFLNWFEGIVVSGTERMRKPTAEFYHLLLTRYGVEVQEAVFIDDNLRNIQAAQAIGLHTVHFQSPEQLRTELEAFGVLPAVR
ncbi:HAD family hydrolase [Hymenobacter cavernae]|uniref:Hydrolase n=1 Tax=Hymenobacter cavernae TaxID=2044852 RepID=A0ABQ1TM21_9BACT|nr:HAD family phosphatase [Hymenobacter cavernae]GGE98444.1 hydrolase [Hymenobacter cavernae]